MPYFIDAHNQEYPLEFGFRWVTGQEIFSGVGILLVLLHLLPAGVNYLGRLGG
jgi:hypothetical protein